MRGCSAELGTHRLAPPLKEREAKLMASDPSVLDQVMPQRGKEKQNQERPMGCVVQK